MQQLTRIAFTELKIDRAFVANATHDKSARVILASSLDMARQLDLVAVAEGVETEADWALLAELGCELAQGYLIARPMDAKAFEDWLRSAAPARVPVPVPAPAPAPVI
jgi:EAL domain-containing protein (putative c-di-GMP-specific phosphodiesterase class I)